MSSNPTATADKRARIEAMKAKKAQDDVSRGISLGSTGSDKLSKGANGSLSRARVTATILGPARPGSGARTWTRKSAASRIPRSAASC